MAAGIRAGIGEEPSSFAFPGTTDATYLVPAGVPCVICGPGNLARAHRENERVPVAELGVATRLRPRRGGVFRDGGSLARVDVWDFQ